VTRSWLFIALAGVMAVALIPLAACHRAPPELVRPQVASVPDVAVAPRESFIPREPRLMPAETLIRSYTAIFGDLVEPEARTRYDRSNQRGRYFGWSEQLSALGLPDYTRDQARASQTNTIMIAAFEKLAIALCDRAAIRDLRLDKANVKPLSPELKALVQVEAPPVFAFEPKSAPLSEADFVPRFDVLHRTFLGYPAALAPREREAEFYALYKKVEQRHVAAKSGQAPHIPAWSAVCQGLARHPEFHHY
jgi:hypothetical protein